MDDEKEVYDGRIAIEMASDGEHSAIEALEFVERAYNEGGENEKAAAMHIMELMHMDTVAYAHLIPAFKNVLMYSAYSINQDDDAVTYELNVPEGMSTPWSDREGQIELYESVLEELFNTDFETSNLFVDVGQGYATGVNEPVGWGIDINFLGHDEVSAKTGGRGAAHVEEWWPCDFYEAAEMLVDELENYIKSKQEEK